MNPRESIQDILDIIKRNAWLRFEDDVVGLLDEFPRDCNLTQVGRGLRNPHRRATADWPI